MREVKFRAWQEDAVEKDLRFWTWKEMLDHDLNAMVNSPKYKIMQYTGLTDKNGTEIYEGDILTGFVFKERWTGSVEYLAPYFAVLGENSHIILEDLEECRVIGNIYEHPHLLKE